MRRLSAVILSAIFSAVITPITVLGGEYCVCGQVVTNDGKPLPYAYVSVDGKSYATQADKDGRFSLQLPEGCYSITAHLLGYKPDVKVVNQSNATGLSFTLDEDLINLNTVTVTGTRTPRLLVKAPVVTQIITRDEILKTDATNLKDVLTEEIPGLEFTFSMDQQVSLTMSGLGGLSILILVDGERLAGETLDNADYLRLNTDDIERIEIIKGAASALYGSNSVGAVMNIITRRPKEAWSTNVNTHFGTHGEQRHGGSVGFKTGQFTSLTNVQTNSIDTYDIKDREGDGRTTVYGNRQWNFKERLSYQIDSKNLLTGHAGYYFHERNYSEYKNNRARDFMGGLQWQGTLGTSDRLNVSYTFDRYDKSEYYTRIRKDFIDYKNVQNSLRVLYTHDFSCGVTWIAGGDAMSDYLMSYQFDDNGSHSEYTADVFTQAEWKINEHWNLVGGLRADWLSKSSWNVSPKIAAMYSVGNLNVRASYSRGFRAPTLKEKYMNFDMGSIFMIYGNSSLTAEHSHSFALSGEYAYKRYSITATGYFNIMGNEITTLWDSSLVTSISNGSMVYQNIKGRDLVGADVTLMGRYPCGIGAKVSYAYFHEIARGGNLKYSDTRPHSLTVKIDYRKTLRDYEFDVIFSGRVLSSVNYYTYASDYSSRDVLTSSPAYSIWKLALSQRIRRAFNLLLSVDNLFNYRSKVFQYNSPVTTGTTFSGTLSIDIEQLFKRSDAYGKNKK
ncbi:MAG: TonB-dependent receptor [Prevotella sp.]|nr:TonB-dependent receptor [Prevotella sp.]